MEATKVLTKALMRAEDLFKLPDGGRHYELVRGELIEMSPPGGQHGRIALRVGSRLLAHVESRQLGQVIVESGFRLESNPDTVRGPDVSFMAASRIPAGGIPTGFISGAPDLAVEIVSPGDTVDEIQAKVDDYLSHGTQQVWVIHPATQSVTVYDADGTTQRLRKDDLLDGGEVVPGFSARVGELF
ncbi:MAG: hypothetical protein A2Z04_02440 [Chloroflexi bacterium RBG_16_57_9]|nr:MAG: hypothetical protein A2Z04_02440 [Chloroflexi bacterium RBG_16_57_9]